MSVSARKCLLAVCVFPHRHDSVIRVLFLVDMIQCVHWMITVSDRAPRYREARIEIAGISHTVCFTMQIVQQIPTLLIVAYLCIGSGYAQCYFCLDSTPPCVNFLTGTGPSVNCSTNYPTVRRECQQTEFTCNNGQCISSTDICDGTRNCADGSDEISSKCAAYCRFPSVRCDDGACVPAANLSCVGSGCFYESGEGQKKCSETGQPLSLWITTPISTSTSISSVAPDTNACRAPPQPQNGQWKLSPSQCPVGQECSVPEGTELGLGSYITYSCDSGYKIRGPTHVICTTEGRWLNIPVCIEIRCRALTTASINADCVHDNEWVPCESPVRPRTIAKLNCKNSYRPETNLMFDQRKYVRCNENGQWEPEPMRCVSVCGTTLPDIILLPTIFGGFRANVTEFPWHASLYFEEPDKTKRFSCGATVIKENFLLTVAHCVFDELTGQLVKANQIYILVGNIFRDYDSPLHNPTIVKKNQVKHIYVPRNYLGLAGNFICDIAVLELVEPFVLSYFLVPACIDTLNDRGELEPGSYGKMAGFGRTEFGESSAVLQTFTVPVISYGQCKSASIGHDTERYITVDKFCAGYTNGSSVCDGDSGGGLVFKTNGLWYLRGIITVSLGAITFDGTVRCDNNLYSLFTDISTHIPWVENVIAKIGQGHRDVLCSNVSRTRCS